MTSKTLLWTVAAITLPFGIANAQSPSATMASGTPAATAESVPADQPATTDAAMLAEAAAPAADAATDSTTASETSSTTAEASAAVSDKPVAVSKADVQAGATVLGSDGAAVGKVESVSADAAVVSTGKARAQIPFTSFGKTDKGLVIAMSKSQFEAAAAGKSAS